MVGPIRTLDDVYRHGGTVQATCRECQRVALFDATELYRHFMQKGWPKGWPMDVAKRLRCSSPPGCGARNPKLAWLPGSPPPQNDPHPPRPRLVRQTPQAPPGIDRSEWEKARTDRDRRRLIRRARG